MDNQRIEFTPEVIVQQRAICDAATPGPWRWEVNQHAKDIKLLTDYSEHYYVMGFERWGMQGAQPLFQAYDRYDGPVQERGSQGMKKAIELATWNQAYRHDDGTIDHPDAIFIVAASAGYRAALDALEASMQREEQRNSNTIRLIAEREAEKNAEIARLTSERDAEKRRADAAVKDLKTVCTIAIDEGADCACCAVCKHSRGMPPLGSSDDCDILRYDEKTDEIIGECKWEWRGPCAENAPTMDIREESNDTKQTDS